MNIIFESFESVEKYREDWNRLAQIQNNALISYEWFSCCASAFHSNDRLFIICIVCNEQLIAVAPLYKNRQGNNLQIIGSHRLYEPSSLLYKDTDALTDLLHACTSVGMPILLSRCYINAYYETQVRVLSWNALFFRRLSTNTQYINVSSDFDEYEKSLSSRKRYDIRRAIKKCKEYGDLTFDINTHNIDKIDKLLNKAYDIEDQSWKHRSSTSIRLNDELKRFISCLFYFHSRNDNCVIAYLRIDNKPVATQLSIQQFNTLWTLKIGYNENYAACSPGVLLMHEMIRYAHENGIKVFEFLGNEESWLRSWKPQTRQYNNLFIYPFTFKGLSGLLVDMINILTNKFMRVVYK